jgi:hypothetical protein
MGEALLDAACVEVEDIIKRPKVMPLSAPSTQGFRRREPGRWQLGAPNCDYHADASFA